MYALINALICTVNRFLRIIVLRARGQYEWAEYEYSEATNILGLGMYWFPSEYIKYARTNRITINAESVRYI